MSKSNPGIIIYDRKRVTSREDDGKIFLLTVPSGQHYELDATAAKLWRRIEDGHFNISDLVEAHAKQSQVSNDVAAFQVISFLDELRAAGFIDFELEKERNTAPLIDAELSHIRPRFVKKFSAATNNDKKIEAIVLDTPNMSLHIRDARNVAERISGKGIGALQRIVTLTAESEELTLTEISALIDNPESIVNYDKIEVVGTLLRPSLDLTINQVVDIMPPQESFTSQPGRRIQRVVVIVIVFDDTIVIVVVGDGTGTSAGKSRSACKTMCV